MLDISTVVCQTVLVCFVVSALPGIPVSEMESKQSSQIRVLTKEEIEKMRVVGRVSHWFLGQFCPQWYIAHYVTWPFWQN